MHGFKSCSCFYFYKLIECTDKFRSAWKCRIPLGIHSEFSPSGSSWIRSELVIPIRIWSENLALLQPFEVKKVLTRFQADPSRSTQIQWVTGKTSQLARYEFHICTRRLLPKSILDILGSGTMVNRTFLSGLLISPFTSVLRIFGGNCINRIEIHQFLHCF